MTDNGSSFEVGIDFESVLAAISKQIYETPLAFLRENVQNAVDAIRIQALRDESTPGDDQYRVDVDITDRSCTIRDNGIGMSRDDLRRFFWTIGASGKRTDEAREAGCVGMFGIGGFANLGVCGKLEVISQTQEEEIGTATSLSEDQIKEAAGSIPQVTSDSSEDAAPRGTIVIGHLREPPDIEELERYLRDFVRYSGERIYFNGRRISQESLAGIAEESDVEAVSSPSQWEEDGVRINGRLFEDRGHTMVAELSGLSVDGSEVRLSGVLRFEAGPIDLFKRGFKLCATKVGSTIGVTGRIDCDRLSPTAGRDSPDADSAALLNRIVTCMERTTIGAVLDSSDRIAQHTRVFPYILRNGWGDRLGNVTVRLADGSDSTLASLRVQGERGVGIYFGHEQKEALIQIMQARGNMVVILPQDRHKQKAVRQFLESLCGAKPFEGVVECHEIYDQLTRFERVFVSELEASIENTYEVRNARVIPGKLTEDIPVFLSDRSGTPDIEIFVDVRHPEITKLEHLGFTPLMYSMISAFCSEYLGPTLRKRSPKFFGTGAINLDLLAKRRSELWILLQKDIEVVSRQSQRQVVRSSDVQVVRAGAPAEAEAAAEASTGSRPPKLIQITGDDEFSDIRGHYIRLPEGATRAYGDVIRECDSRGVVWAGNKVVFVASDTISSAFQFEIRLDHLIVVTDENGKSSVEGAAELTQPLQELHNGIYFPIPLILTPILVPEGDVEIRLEVRSEWIDMKTARTWEPSPAP